VLNFTHIFYSVMLIGPLQTTQTIDHNIPTTINHAQITMAIRTVINREQIMLSLTETQIQQDSMALAIIATNLDTKKQIVDPKDAMNNNNKPSRGEQPSRPQIRASQQQQQQQPERPQRNYNSSNSNNRFNDQRFQSRSVNNGFSVIGRILIIFLQTLIKQS
jgi:hypothetical protein